MDTFMEVYNRNLRGKKYNQTHTHTQIAKPHLSELD